MKPLPLLDNLRSPADLRRFDDTQLDQLADEIRFRIKETVSATGGHLASNMGVVELTVALHRVFDFSADRLLWDVGHQAYPHKLLTGRAAQFDSNRTEGGISGFPDPKESPYDIAKVGHSSTAISTGVGVAEADRRQGLKRRTVVVVGDGSLTGGMCFEGLINAGDLGMPMLVILNDNGNFIDPPTGALHRYLDQIRSGRLYNRMRDRMLGILKKMPYGDEIERMAEHAEQVAHKMVTPGYIFEDLGFRYFGPIDGHNRKEVERILAKVNELDVPVLLHVATTKGGGWAPSTKDPLTFHGPKGFDCETGEFAAVEATAPTYSDVFADAMIKLAEQDPKLVAITAAMPSGTKLSKFGKRFPDRMYDVGICEQHSFAFAQGLAVAGLRPVLAHYSTFAQRGYDQFFQEFVVQRDLGVVMTLDRGGCVGEDGETHQGLYDIGWARVLPGTVLMSPKDGGELEAMLNWSHKQREQPQQDRAASYVIRYPKEPVPELTWGLERPNPVMLGKAEVLKRGTGLMVWAYGCMVWRAWEAIARLGEAGKDVTLVNARFAKPFDRELLVELAEDHKQVLTLEDHALPCGFGSVVLENAAAAGLQLAVHCAGVRDELVSHAKRERQLADHGLDVDGVEARMRQILGLAEGAIPFAKQA
ncbi:MAG: 1-deoxy-D-xylulose-5-phosphate synthase [Planctomycetota bacterium]|jgi:1-deoxy-D-xylulose-5-phosphate synthase|nr:1-deoxy-D-xylulose-5-phosphate synthase [Planctomycetota bacterium]